MFDFLKDMVSKANAKIKVAQLSKKAQLLVALKRAAAAVNNENAATHYNNMWAKVISAKWELQDQWSYSLCEPNWFDRILVWLYADLD